jgi:hypothetical protein
MIRVSISDDGFNRAYLKAFRAFPVEPLESPRQYGARWREQYKCRIDPSSTPDKTYYIFDHDVDYTAFMLRWS